MSIDQLAETAQAMVAAGKGIIAIDESNATIKKRFDGVGVENSEENRRAYREMLLTTPNLGEHISGAILFDETLRQSTKDGVPFAKVMAQNGIIPGIKVDKGPVPLAGFPGATIAWAMLSRSSMLMNDSVQTRRGHRAMDLRRPMRAGAVKEPAIITAWRQGRRDDRARPSFRSPAGGTGPSPAAGRPGRRAR